MKILTSYKNGFVDTFRNVRLVTIVYLFVLVPVLLVALSYWSAFRTAMDGFISPGKLLGGFDYTAYTELTKIEGDRISASYVQATWLVVFYLFVSIFITAGTIFILTNRDVKSSLSAFVTGGSRYFWRFLKLKFYFIFIQIFFAAIVWVPFAMIMKFSEDGTLNEKKIFFDLLPFLIIHALIFLYFFTISNYSKMIIVAEDTRKVLGSMWSATKFVSSKFFGAYTLTILLLVIPVLLIVIYWKFEPDPASRWAIFFILIVQQIFIFLRSFMRIWFLAGQVEYYRS